MVEERRGREEHIGAHGEGFPIAGVQSPRQRGLVPSVGVFAERLCEPETPKVAVGVCGEVKGLELSGPERGHGGEDVWP